MRARALRAAIGFGFASVLVVVACVPSGCTAAADTEPVGTEAPQAGPDEFLALFSDNQAIRDDALSLIDIDWQESFVPMAIETIRMAAPSPIATQLFELLEVKTGASRPRNINRWFDWLWSQDIELHPEYASFKSRLYSRNDERFRHYFAIDYPTEIRLDEVRWGGIVQDGIPPLREPTIISAEEARYLSDTDIVFAVFINGSARAYPKRILGWHELLTDTLGGVNIAGVYCTLCGAMIVYDTDINGVHYELGTSGFLFRSNKLMYDQATQSLWSTLWGRPVVGPLVGTGVQLPRRSVVTTTWGAWRRLHPDTTVLSRDTGHTRDYREGAAYRDYFSNDSLMFNVPEIDYRLLNKDEVLGLAFNGNEDDAVAISIKYLRKARLHHDYVSGTDLVVLTDDSGANRVYETGGQRFTSFGGRDIVRDERGVTWKVTEDALISPGGVQLKRLPAHRAFWFAWKAAYPKTLLVHG